MNGDLNSIITSIIKAYSKLNYPWKVRDLRDPYNPYYDPRYESEFYHPNEYANPYPGYPTIDIYKDAPNMQQSLMGEMLHYIPYVDPGYSNLKQQFGTSLTPWQRSINTDIDAYIRGGLFPQNNPEWQGIYTPEQTDILGKILEYLK
jgi:hypothetical protein